MEELIAALEELAPRPRRARHRHRGRRAGVLAPATTSARWSIATSPFYQRAVRHLHRADGGDPPAAAAGDRAACTGIATAAGCQLVAACDLAVAAEERALRHARREDRAVLLDADGAAVARDRPQARARDAPDRRRRSTPPRRCEWGLVNRVVAGRRARRDGRRRSSTRSPRSSPLTVGDRQGGLLRADRPRRAPRLRPHEGRDGDERARRRRAGGHLRVPREAPGRPGPGGRAGRLRRRWVVRGGVCRADGLLLLAERSCWRPSRRRPTRPGVL